MIRVTIYFDSGREQSSRDVATVESAFDVCTRYAMLARAVNLRTDKLYIWRPNADNRLEVFSAKLADVA